MFKNFSSLDHRSIFLVHYYRPYFRKKKKKKKSISLEPLFSPLHRTYPSKTKQNKTKTKPLKGTNGRQKTHEIFHVYCIFYSGFMCQTTVIFGITKDGSLVLNPFASWNCFAYRNLLQNGANDMSEWLTYETAFCKKVQNFV